MQMNHFQMGNKRLVEYSSQNSRCDAFLFLNSKLGCLITRLLKVAALTILKSSLFNRMRSVLPANSSFFDREIKLDNNNNNNNNNKVKKGEGKAYISLTCRATSTTLSGMELTMVQDGMRI